MKKKKLTQHFCALFTKTLYSKEWKALSKSEMILYIYIKSRKKWEKSRFNKASLQVGLMENESTYELTLINDRVLKK